MAKKSTVKKKPLKKKKKQKIKTEDDAAKIVLKERQAVVTFQANKHSKQKVKKLSLGFTEYPSDVPVSEIRLRAGLTRGVVDFNYLRVDVEASDVTLANSSARKECADRLADEVLDIAVLFTKKSAKRLFDTEV